jgi:LPXTG-site transpeptidase (sortase) family protein
MVTGYYYFAGRIRSTDSFTYRQFVDALNQSKVEEVLLKPNASGTAGKVIIEMKEGDTYQLYVTDIAQVDTLLRESYGNVNVIVDDIPQDKSLINSALMILATAAIFTDLDQMREGDLINLYVLDHALSYEVDQILTVKPTEIEALDLVPGEDLLTLVTCTPYAVNTHRLLVRGHRVPYVAKTSPVTESLNFLTPQRLALIAVGVLLGMVLVWLVDRRRRRRRESERPQGRHAA